MQLLYAAAGTALRRQLVPLNFSKLRNVDRVDPLYVQNCRQIRQIRQIRKAICALSCSRNSNIVRPRRALWLAQHCRAMGSVLCLTEGED